MNILSAQDYTTHLEAPTIDPNFSISENEISLKIDCCKEYQFSISDLQGRLIKKGKFKESIKIDISKLVEGRYEIVIFNDCDLFRKPFIL